MNSSDKFKQAMSERIMTEEHKKKNGERLKTNFKVGNIYWGERELE